MGEEKLEDSKKKSESAILIALKFISLCNIQLINKKEHAYKHEVKFSFVRDDLTVLRNASCQDNLQILPETTFSLVKEKNWNQANG